MHFYTSFRRDGANILVREVNGDKRTNKKIRYQPKVYLPTENPEEFSGFTTLDKVQLSEVQFKDMFSAHQYAKDNPLAHGDNKYEYVCIDELFPGENCPYDVDRIETVIVDIEVCSKEEFPDLKTADQEVTSIAMHHRGVYYVWACVDYVNKLPLDVRYTKCANEHELLTRFIKQWVSIAPDVLSGWFVEFFDLPYLIKRMNRIGMADDANKLSVWGKMDSEDINLGRGELQTKFDVYGLATLDMIELYKRYSQTPRESYTLDAIAEIELGRKKVKYDGSLYNLYKTDPQKFVEYNIIDVELVVEINNKMKLLELVYAMAYWAKVNYNDVFSQIRMWDTLIMNYLRNTMKVIPTTRWDRKVKLEQNAGGFVKDSLTGKKSWVVTFDVTSLYPSLIMSLNISPDTLIGMDERMNVTDILAGKVRAQPGELVASNGAMFATDRKGFMTDLIDKMFAERKKAKDEKKKYEKLLEALPENASEVDRRTLTALKVSFDSKQEAIKRCLNSGYGALSSEYFRWFDIRLAEAITLSGQCLIQYIIRDFNAMLNKLVGTTDADYCIASDTDSLIFDFGKFVEKYGGEGQTPQQIAKKLDAACKAKFSPFLVERVNDWAKLHGINELRIGFARDIIADRGLFLGKKNYVLQIWDKEGVAYSKPDVKIKGVVGTKVSTPTLGRKMAKQAYINILNGTSDEFIKFVAECRKQYLEAPFEDIASPKACKELSKFINAEGELRTSEMTVQPQIRAAFNYNKLLIEKGVSHLYPKIKNGDKVKFLYLKEPNPIHSHVIGFVDKFPPEFGLEKYVDRNLQFERSLVQHLKSITDLIGWQIERVDTLDEFF